MKTNTQMRAFFTVGALALVSSTWGCVADRPSRNGVFNENQYIRKDFLVRPGDSDTPDRGWLLQATVTDASEPNVFGDDGYFGLFAGARNQGQIVHFTVTSDKMNMVNSRELSTVPSVGRQPEVVNSWPITNVDLKYQINLDGEKTNFYIENQELDWQLRQWLKVNLDKNDMSDLAPLGSFYNDNIAKCADVSNASATLVPNSFSVDEKHEYMEWSVMITLPIKWSDASCIESFGAMGIAAQKIGREYETVTLKYSMVRSNPKPTYQPLVVAEKDPIKRKYGPIQYAAVNRDPDTGLLAQNEYVVRFDPTKEIKWYFEKGFPDSYKGMFTDDAKVLVAGVKPASTTIAKATNSLLADAGAKATVSFHEYNEPLEDGTPIERKFGDVRFNVIRWIESLDQQDYFAGATSFTVDPRSGEALNSSIVLENHALKDAYVERIDAYLQSIGASAIFNNDWPQNAQRPDPADPTKKIDISCTYEGQTAPIIEKELIANHNGLSTLFAKIQQYLYKPTGDFGPLGPQDFIWKQDDDFRSAYFAILPYFLYGDPELNQFVIPEGGSGQRPGGNEGLWAMVDQERQYHDVAAKMDRGYPPFDIASPTGADDAVQFARQYKRMALNHRALKYTKQAQRFSPLGSHSLSRADQMSSFAMETVMAKDARHCILDGGSLRWETKDEWLNSLVSTYWSQVFWHEFGHAMGLEHNFMGSVDQPNFPIAVDSQNNPIKNPAALDADGNPIAGTDTQRYAMYSSSVMEYNAPADRVFWQAGWGPYDRGAITWIYANNGGAPPKDPSAPAALGISGQTSSTAPWIDKNGFTPDGSKEIQYLYCNEVQARYSPLCRPGDMGTTPSEIVANDIDAYEWQYKWRNFRLYRKVWDDSKYPDVPLDFVTEARRWLSLWAYDMSNGELTAKFSQIGVVPPPNAPSAQLYYAQLTDKFTAEMSAASSLVAAFHEAIIQQSSGQRPYVSIYDNYFGDVTQQGITLDKYYALTSWLSVWPVDNYDVNQSAGAYIAAYSPFSIIDNINGTAIGELYQTVAEQTTASMLGAGYDSFSYFKPTGVGLFTWDTHSDAFQALAIDGALREEVRDWTGGLLFNRLDDFLAYFRDLAVQNNFVSPEVGIDCEHGIATCTYDPRTPRAYAVDTFFSDQFNEFLGPDGRRYAWTYVKDRNQWVICDRDRNVGTYQILHTYNADVLVQKDDGNYGGLAYQYENQVKYYIDYFTKYTTEPHTL